MPVKKHYNEHLGRIYAWVVDDLNEKIEEFSQLVKEFGLADCTSAIDLGAGTGAQAAALANLSMKVCAIDFCEPMLLELASNCNRDGVHIVNDDIRNVDRYAGLKPDLVMCNGDTILHLDNVDEIKDLVSKVCKVLNNQKTGFFVCSIRDYSGLFNNAQAFIPVRSDENRILTCILEPKGKSIQVTDLLHERSQRGWVQKVSSYTKVLLTVAQLSDIITTAGFEIIHQRNVNGLWYLVGRKKGNGAFRSCL